MKTTSNTTKPKGEELTHGQQSQVDPGHGSTTQGGDNFGQGSSQLGNESIKQGSEGNADTNQKGLNEEKVPGYEKELE